MKLQKMIVTNKDLSQFNSLQIAVNAKYYIECKTDSDIEEAFHFVNKNKIKFLIKFFYEFFCMFLLRNINSNIY